MQIKFSINEKYEKPEIVICNHEMNGEVKKLADTISRAVNETLVGYMNNEAVVLQQTDIVRVYAQNQKVLATTNEGDYNLHYKLYELEEMLDKLMFVRISKSELVNVRKIVRLDTSMAGTVKVILKDNVETFVSRRNIAYIKKALLQGGKKHD